MDQLTTWRPIATAPRDGTYILLAGDSGYTTTPLRVEVCRYDAEYRPRSPWVDHSNECFTDGGDPPLYWLPLPEEPPIPEPSTSDRTAVLDEVMQKIAQSISWWRMQDERIDPARLQERLQTLTETMSMVDMLKDEEVSQ